MTDQEMLEAVAEAIRQARRSYVKIFDLSSVTINAAENMINITTVDSDGAEETWLLDLYRASYLDEDK